MISEFQGRYRFLSNFWPVSISVPFFDNMDTLVSLPSLEHAYVVLKCGTWRIFKAQSDLTIHAYTRLSPGQAKRWGRKIELRPDWDNVRVDIMHELLRLKFKPGC